ncbi:MAG: hypothetical protein LBT74_05360 [Acidobacteriota bacterium]|jgi:hypothetical protein|nr:hypothetical protein [Acidobacteriota bacterium]
MAKKWIAINMVLLVAVMLLGRELYRSVQGFDAANDPARIQPATSGDTAAAVAPAVPAVAGASPNADYSMIPERTIFSDLRGQEEEEVASVAPTTPPLAQNQKPILVGTLMVEDQYQALVVEPTTAARGGSRRAQTRRVGDQYRGYTITSIAADRMVLENGSRREVIELRGDARRPAGPAARPGAGGATNVVWIGAGKSGGGALSVATAATPPPVRGEAATRQVRGPQTAAGGAGGGVPTRQPGTAPQQDDAADNPVTPTTPTTPAAASPSRPSRPAAPGGQRVIRSPFGDIIRPGSE